jgi:bacterioferritin-associated ferredoxin
MQPDDNVCLCFRVSQRKLVNYIKREKPQVPSQLADCLGAGTGCQWCVPFLKKLFDQWQNGEEPNLPIAPESYAKRRAAYHLSGTRDELDT